MLRDIRTIYVYRSKIAFHDMFCSRCYSFVVIKGTIIKIMSEVGRFKILNEETKSEIAEIVF